MSRRFWLYSAGLIAVLSLGVWLLITNRQIASEQARLTTVGTEQATSNLQRFLNRQTDSYKLISLAKLYNRTHPELLKPVIERAYALNPESRDIVILASEYEPKLREELKRLDPLYYTEHYGTD